MGAEGRMEGERLMGDWCNTIKRHRHNVGTCMYIFNQNALQRKVDLRTYIHTIYVCQKRHLLVIGSN